MPTRDDYRQYNRLQYAINDLKNIFRTIMDILTKMDLDEMVHLYSRKIDVQILKTVKETGWMYRGGQFTVTYVTKETFSLEISLYFQDAEGEGRQV